MSKYSNVTSITGDIEANDLRKVNLTYLVTGKKESNFIVQKIHGLKTIDYTGSSEFSIIDLEGNKPIGACVNNCSNQVLRVEINGSNSNESIYNLNPGESLVFNEDGSSHIIGNIVNSPHDL